MLWVAGGGLGNIWGIRDRRLIRGPKIPYEQHNAQPFRNGVLVNHSPTHRMIFQDGRGHVLKSFPVPLYSEHQLEFANVPKDHAYQGFCRGIAVINDNLIVQGSSPATVNVFQFDPPMRLKSVNVTRDVRNSVHGLEIWPFGEMP